MRSSWLAGLLVAAFVSVAHAAVVQPQSQDFSPHNDDFANAQVLPDSTNATMGNLYNATNERGEVRYAKGSYGSTVWYKFTASRTGRAVVELAPIKWLSAPLQIQAFSGPTIASLKCLAKAKVSEPNVPLTGSVAFDTVAGTTYYLQVDINSDGSDHNSKTDFLIAMQQFGTSGGFGMLTLQPAILRDETYDQYFMLIANGFKTAAKLKLNMLRGGRQMEAWTPFTTFAPGQSAWLNVMDSNGHTVNDAVPGRLQIVANDASTSAILGTRTIDFVLVPNSGHNLASLTTRFAMSGQGVARSSRFSSKVVIKNSSNIAANFCQFSSNDFTMTPRWREVLADGKLGKFNAPFSLAAGATRKFIVSATSLDDGDSTSYSKVKPSCSNYTPPDSYLTLMNSMEGDPQLGHYAAVKIDIPAANDFRQISMAGMQAKMVRIAVTNTGEYTGHFTVSAFGASQYMWVKAYCTARKDGSCISAFSTRSADLDLNNGETGYVTLSVYRTSTTEEGEIDVSVRRAEQSSYGAAGISGFEMTN
jgi:hypothetical protein